MKICMNKFKWMLVSGGCLVDYPPLIPSKAWFTDRIRSSVGLDGNYWKQDIRSGVWIVDDEVG